MLGRGQAAVYFDTGRTRTGLTEGRLFLRLLAGEPLAASLSTALARRRVKSLRRCAGVTDLDLSAHSLPAGFMTQCALDYVPSVEGMALSLHRSEATCNRYYRTGALKDNRASCPLTIGGAAKEEAP